MIFSDSLQKVVCVPYNLVLFSDSNAVLAHKRKKRNWEENDYYDSDEDTFLDRTGTSK